MERSGRFKALGGYATPMFISGIVGIFVPSLVSLVIALAAIFVAGVIVIATQYLVDELRAKPAAPSNAS